MKESIYRIYSEKHGKDEFLVRAESAEKALALVKEYLLDPPNVRIYWKGYAEIMDNYTYKPMLGNTVFL